MKVIALSRSWRRTIAIVIVDLGRLISFYRARAIVRRALDNERNAAEMNFKELRNVQSVHSGSTRGNR